MTNATKQAPKDKFQEEFEALPLEEKIKKLLRLEAVTLTEAFNYGVNESMKAADRLGDVLSDFGKKVETEFKKATQHGATPCDPPRAETAKPKGAPPKKAPRRAPKA
jgi:hypothetical protein